MRHVLSAFAVLAVAAPALSTPAMACIDPRAMTAEAVAPALDHICAAQPGEATRPAFVKRMRADFGFDYDKSVYQRRGGDGRIRVALTASGCDIRLDGHSAMVEAANEILFERGRGMAWTVRDRHDPGAEGTLRRSDRGDDAQGRLAWKSFTPKGEGKGAWLEASWTRPVKR